MTSFQNELLYHAYHKASVGDIFSSGICPMPKFCRDPFVRWASIKTCKGWTLKYVFDDLTLDEIKSSGDIVHDKRIAQEITNCTPAMLTLYGV